MATPIQILLSQSEIVFLANTINEILNGLNAIEAFEFQTRLGIPRPEAVELHQRLLPLTSIE